MGIGLGIFLMVVGAILSFAVKDHVSGVDLGMVGYILMGAGVLSLIAGFLMNHQNTHQRNEAIVEHRETGVPTEVREVR